MFCQVTKEKLDEVGDSYYCKSLNIRYPVKNNITFMGFEKSKKEENFKILLDSQQHQGTADTLKNDYEFAKISYPLIAISLSALKKIFPNDVKEKIAVNVGSGGDPSSNELSALGYETYACDIEPNSLFMSSFWDDKIGKGVKRIACNCFSLPFPNESVDLIFCKEFLHHMENYDGMINEFSRILKIGGVAIVIEPTKTHRTTKEALESPGHHYQSNVNYLNSFLKNGFKIDKYYLHFILRDMKLKHKISKPLYSFFNKQLEGARSTSTFFKSFIQRIFDGQNVWYLKKNRNVDTHSKNQINHIELIDPSFLTIDSNIYNNEYFEKAVLLYSQIRKQYGLI